MKSLAMLLFCVLLALIGAAGGWLARSQSATTATDSAHAHDDEPVRLPAQTLKNLGVTTGDLEITEFDRTRDLPAVVEHSPLNHTPVFSLVGGRVAAVAVEPGATVSAGEPLLTIVRDPIPPPTLAITEALLQPAQEAIHQAALSLRKTGAEKAILNEELTRLRQFSGGSGQGDVVIPRQAVIDCENKLRRATSAYDSARAELRAHGFEEEQLKELESENHLPPLGPQVWRRTLRHNGLWPENAAQLLELIPAEQRAMPWVIATVGELAASGLASEGFLRWMKDNPTRRSRFLDFASLLQRGHSMADIRALSAAGALEPMVTIRAPGAPPADWDVGTLDVRDGARVEPGTPLLTLVDARTMRLRVDPEGSEKAVLLDALRAGRTCTARPLVEGAGPMLTDITLTFVEGDGAHPERTYATLENQPLATRDRGGRGFRSWTLRPGLRYVLQVPFETMANVFVVPASAVTTDGPHKIVYVRRGLDFKSRKVEVLYQDEEVVVLPADDRIGNVLRPGQTIALTGAYALGLALEKQAAVGHGHPH